MSVGIAHFPQTQPPAHAVVWDNLPGCACLRRWEEEEDRLEHSVGMGAAVWRGEGEGEGLLLCMRLGSRQWEEQEVAA